MLVRNRLKLVNFRTRYRLQLEAVQDVLFPEFKQFFRARSTGRAARLVLERFPNPADVAAAAPEQLSAVVIEEARALTLGPRLPELQRLAANSAGLTRDIGQMLRIQAWLLRQLRILEEEITATEKTLVEALGAWPEQTREVLQSFPHMSAVRAAVLLSAIGDVNAFGSDRRGPHALSTRSQASEATGANIDP